MQQLYLAGLENSRKAYAKRHVDIKSGAVLRSMIEQFLESDDSLCADYLQMMNNLHFAAKMIKEGNQPP
jgi:hypothetical protein